MKQIISAVLLSVFVMALHAQVSEKASGKSDSQNVKTEVRKSNMVISGEKTEQSMQGEGSYEMRIADGLVKTCFGQFFDSGGPNGAYKANEDYTYTIESGTEGAHFILRFVEFYLSDGDELTVYDGNSTASKVIGTFSSTNKIPFELVSTGGSLTFVFKSDETGAGSGWRASIACYVGDRKVLKTDGTESSTRLYYSIVGVKSDQDIQLIRDILSEKEFVRKSEFDKSSQTLAVFTSDENVSEVILNLIQSTQENLGYNFTVKLVNVIPAKIIK